MTAKEPNRPSRWQPHEAVLFTTRRRNWSVTAAATVVSHPLAGTVFIRLERIYSRQGVSTFARPGRVLLASPEELSRPQPDAAVRRCLHSPRLHRCATALERCRDFRCSCRQDAG